MNYNKMSAILTCLMIVGLIGNVVVGQSQQVEAFEVNESSFIRGIIGLVIGMAVATSLLPNVFNDTATLQADANGDLDPNEEGLIGTWNIVIIAGIILGIIGMVM